MCAWPSPACPPPAFAPAWDTVGMQQENTLEEEEEEEEEEVQEKLKHEDRVLRVQDEAPPVDRRTTAAFWSVGPGFIEYVGEVLLRTKLAWLEDVVGGEDHVPGRTAGSAGTTTPGGTQHKHGH
eukprot:8229760-Pyramimonas_sp.AAC.1